MYHPSMYLATLRKVEVLCTFCATRNTFFDVKLRRAGVLHAPFGSPPN